MIMAGTIMEMMDIIITGIIRTMAVIMVVHGIVRLTAIEKMTGNIVRNPKYHGGTGWQEQM